MCFHDSQRAWHFLTDSRIPDNKGKTNANETAIISYFKDEVQLPKYIIVYYSINRAIQYEIRQIFIFDF